MTTMPGQSQVQTAQEEVSALPEAVAQARPRTAAAPSRWTDERFWRRWSLRLLGAWLLLSLLLVGLRVSTASIRPELRDAVTEQQELIKQRDSLSLEVQTLGSAGRIAAWAEDAGMLRFADSLKRAAEIPGVKPLAPAPVPGETPVSVQLQWDAGAADPNTGEQGTP